MIPNIECGIYQHYKGKFYLVLGLAHDANNEGRMVVVYVPLYMAEGPRLAVRDVDEFLSDVQIAENEWKPRFSYLGPTGWADTDAEIRAASQKTESSAPHENQENLRSKPISQSDPHKEDWVETPYDSMEDFLNRPAFEELRVFWQLRDPENWRVRMLQTFRMWAHKRDERGRAELAAVRKIEKSGTMDFEGDACPDCGAELLQATGDKMYFCESRPQHVFSQTDLEELARKIEKSGKGESHLSSVVEDTDENPQEKSTGGTPTAPQAQSEGSMPPNTPGPVRGTRESPTYIMSIQSDDSAKPLEAGRRIGEALADYRRRTGRRNPLL